MLGCHTIRGARSACVLLYNSVALLCVHIITLRYYRAIWLDPAAAKRDAACIVIIPRNVIESSIEKFECTVSYESLATWLTT